MRNRLRILASLVGAAVLLPTGVAHADIYWSNYGAGAIGRASQDGTGANPTLITGASNPLALALDGSHVYWANYNTN